jgi:hypothetical protein
MSSSENVQKLFIALRLERMSFLYFKSEPNFSLKNQKPLKSFPESNYTSSTNSSSYNPQMSHSTDVVLAAKPAEVEQQKQLSKTVTEIRQGDETLHKITNKLISLG